MEYPRLAKAPIVEGLIDLQVHARPEFSPESFKELQDQLRPRYPTCHEARRLQASMQFALNEGSSQSIKAQMVGYRFESQDKRFVFQAYAGGFTLSRLAPYDSWEVLRAEAVDLWGRYVRVAQPLSVTRVAVRYINRIEIPLPLSDFDAYLTAAPKIPASLPQAVSEFFTRVAVDDDSVGASIVVTQVLESPDIGRNVLPMILDIDAFKVDNFDIGEAAFWGTLDRLRVLKNDAFFGSLTEKAIQPLR